ncbi:MAG: hypothetical protein ACIAXF_03415 [Phycisphaerales bacterium JB063]
MTEPPASSKTPAPRRAPSREMFGGPMLGVAAFLVVAVLLGWGLTKLFNLQLASTVQDATQSAVENGFGADTVYTLQRGLLVGQTTGRVMLLYPSRDDLPPATPNRRFTPTLAQFEADPAKYPDIAAIIPAGTRVQFPGMTIDLDNRQTAVHLDAVILDGPYAGQHVTAIYLETREGTPNGGQRVVPRTDLLTPEPADPAPSADPDEPIQSVAPQNPPSSELDV